MEGYILEWDSKSEFSGLLSSPYIGLKFYVPERVSKAFIRFSEVFDTHTC